MSGTNNNPGNIRGTGTSTTNFNGVVNNQNGQFLTFDSPENGFRAIVIDATSKVGAYGTNGYLSFDKWASSFAPRSDGNNPTTYANNLKQWLGKDGISIADLNDPDTAGRFATAVARMEGYNKTGGSLNYGSNTGLISADPVALSGAYRAKTSIASGTVNEQIDKINKDLENKNLSIEERDALMDKKQKLEDLQKQAGGGGGGGAGGSNGSAAPQGKVQIQTLKCNLPEAIGKNPLHDYSNYTYRLIISTLTDQEYNQFVTSDNKTSGDMRGNVFPKPKSILFASGGENIEIKNEFGAQDFFFQELTLKTIPSGSTETGGSQAQSVSIATDIDFVLVEPLGTTLFERLFYAAVGTEGSAKLDMSSQYGQAFKAESKLAGKIDKAQFENLTEPVFLLTIEFKGYKTNTKMTSTNGQAKFMLNSKTGDGNYLVKYHIPFYFSSIDTDITSAGTTYKCKASPAAAQVFFTINQGAPSTSTIPENIKLKDAFAELANRFTDNQKNLPEQFKTTKYVVRIAEDKDLPADAIETKNKARELREQTIFRGGSPVDASRITFMPPKSDDQKKDGRIPGTKQGTTGYRPAVNQNYYTGMGTTMIEIIHQMMMKTNFITDEVAKARGGKSEQGIWWYNIRGNMLFETSKDNKKSPNVEKGKIFEYVIEPYKVYIMNDIDNNDLCQKGPKTFRNYEYIFTGKNNDILRWDINFDGLLYTELQQPEPSSTTAEAGQPNVNTDQAVNAAGQQRGTANQNKFGFPTIGDIKSQGNHQKLYKVNWFHTNETNGQKGRVNNYAELQNAQFMESLFRQQTSSQQWELNMEIIGDPDYLAFFNKLSHMRTQKRTSGEKKPPGTENKTSKTQSKQNAVEYFSSGTDEDGQYLIGVKFRTPTDVDPKSLSYKGMRSADLNGVYVLAGIKHVFRNGKFIQSLELTGTDNKCCPEPDATRFKPQPKASGSSSGSGGTGKPSAQSSASALQEKQKQLASLDQQIADAKKENDPERLAQLYEERSKISNDIANIKASATNPNATDPAPGAPVSSGWLRDNGAFHGAIDKSMPVGTPIQASVEGTVIAAQWQNGSNSKEGYGKFMVIERTEPDGSTTHVYLAHLNEYKAAIGDTVKNTDVVALSGNTGSSTGPHLHYEIRTNAIPGQPYTGTKTNPYQYNPSIPPKK